MGSKAPLLKVFLGSFFIQSSWSFDKMQALGFAAAISPALEAIYAGAEERKKALKRHLAFYNAHPYMASPVLGAAVNLEERAARGEVPAEAAPNFKKRIMGPYGAIGDSFFWGSIRPLASCLGIASAALWGVWGPVVFLVFYNIFHLWMRWVGLEKGYSLGEGVAGYVKSLELPKWGLRARKAASAVIGAFSALAVYRILSMTMGERAGEYMVPGLAAGTLAMTASVFLIGLLLKRGMTVARLIYMVLLPLILYGAINH